MRKLHAFFFILFIISFALAPLGASITASYVPDSHVFFTTGTSPFKTSDFIAHLGTLTLQGKLFKLTLADMTATDTIKFTNLGTQQDSDAQLCAIIIDKTNTPVIQVLGPGDYKINCSNGNSIVTIAFYLHALDNANFFHCRERYTITEGMVGTFNVKAADNNGNGSHSDLNYIPIDTQILPANGGAPSPPIPIYPNIAAPIPYPGTNDTADYLFSIISEEYFDVAKAIGINPTKVGTARLVLCNPCASTSYGVDVKFTDSHNGTDFSLGLDGSKSVYTIGYSLKFRSIDVREKNPIHWDGLYEGSNEEAIFVTGIDETEAVLAPSGDYSDTITVTITPKDTQ